MQWDSSENAGFSQAMPWLKVASNYPQINALAAMADNDSVFYFYQKLIELRKQQPVITQGSFCDLLPLDDRCYVYLRETDTQQLISISNFYGEEAQCSLPTTISLDKAQCLLSNYKEAMETVGQTVLLKPYETRIVLIDK